MEKGSEQPLAGVRILPRKGVRFRVHPDLEYTLHAPEGNQYQVKLLGRQEQAITTK